MLKIMSIEVEISKTWAVFFFRQFYSRKWLQTFFYSLSGSRFQNDIYCLQLGRQEALQIDFSKASYTSDL